MAMAALSKLGVAIGNGQPLLAMASHGGLLPLTSLGKAIPGLFLFFCFALFVFFGFILFVCVFFCVP